MIPLIVLGILPLAVSSKLLITLNWPDSVAGRLNSFPGGPPPPRRGGPPPAANVIVADGLWSLCTGGRKYVQLGHCSSHFIECSRGGSDVVGRTCPFRSFVFMNGRCLPADQFRECDDYELGYIREVSRHLAETEHFCANGAGVYRAESRDSRGVCIREALVCHPNRRDAIPVVCSNHYTLTKNLECVLARVPCPDPPEYITPIRQFFLRRICQAEQMQETRMPSAKQLEHSSCTSWYVKCFPQPSVIHCGSGEVYDARLRKCRRWTTSDACVMSDVCRDHEWQSVPLGECQSQFVYCEGSRGRLYTCAEGLVLSDGNCRPREAVRRCAVCRMKERRPARSCDEYYECVQSREGLQWQLQKCPVGSAFNERQMSCVPDYMCASKKACVHGSSFPINCRDYMYCTGEYYEMFSCPPNTRWNPQTKQCGYDPTCTNAYHQESQCRVGDIIPSADCVTFRVCQNGTFVAAPCENQFGRREVPCSHCSPWSGSGQVDHLRFPGQCSAHDRLPHPEDCAAYYVCEAGYWSYRRCSAADEVFDASSRRCRLGKPWECASYSRVQCQHGEVIVDPNSPKCNRRVAGCRDGKWVNLQCTPGYVFDENELMCVRGTCSLNEYKEQMLPHRPNTGAAPAPPLAKYGVPEFVAPSCKGSFRIADQYDCARFWECGPSGRFESMTCTPGTVYDHRTQQCVRGQCMAPTACLENSFLPLENCGHYKTCHNGLWTDARCHHGKRFINGKCSREDCDNHTYGENHYAQMKCRTGAVRPHPTNQRYYMFCQYGQWTERSCPEGALFNWKVLGCVLSQQQGPDYKPKCYDGETRPVNNECSLYEECIRGQWTRKTCPYGQKFYNGFCVVGSCTGPSQYCRESSGMEGYRRVEHDCSKYYQCVHGKWMERPCGPGTVFNERISVCDHARNVPECGGY